MVTGGGGGVETCESGRARNQAQKVEEKAEPQVTEQNGWYISGLGRTGGVTG